jgi:hypothetical protein
VPTQQRLRRDEQAMAAPGRQQPACGGQQRAVTRSQLRALDLTTQNLQLMAQHEQLDVLGVDASAAAKQQLQQRHEDQVDERQDHRTILSGTTCDADVPGQTSILAPFRVVPEKPPPSRSSAPSLRWDH